MNSSKIYLTKDKSLKDMILLEPGELIDIPESWKGNQGICDSAGIIYEVMDYDGRNVNPNEFKLEVVGGKAMEGYFNEWIQHPFKKDGQMEGNIYHHRPLTDPSLIKPGVYGAVLSYAKEANLAWGKPYKIVEMSDEDYMNHVLKWGNNYERERHDVPRLEKMVAEAKAREREPEEIIDELLCKEVGEYSMHVSKDDPCGLAGALLERLGYLAFGGLPKGHAVVTSTCESFDEYVNSQSELYEDHYLSELIIPVDGGYQSLIVDPAWKWTSARNSPLVEGYPKFSVLSCESLPDGVTAIMAY